MVVVSETWRDDRSSRKSRLLTLDRWQAGEESEGVGRGRVAASHSWQMASQSAGTSAPSCSSVLSKEPSVRLCEPESSVADAGCTNASLSCTRVRGGVQGGRQRHR
eukprot:6199655-Pleurochrysis_carterae.AAC.2